jgi:acetoin:2,6-dichlorophenolindophenol oxidoreductase subunit alpha
LSGTGNPGMLLAPGRSPPGVGRRDRGVEPTKVEKRELYTSMVRSRAFEETAIALAADGKLPGSWLSGIGQEGTLGVIGQLRDDDYLTYTHRGAYSFIGRGSDPKRLLAELCGKQTGYGKGKGGRHIADLEHGILGKSGTVGGHAPIAVGVATAIQIRGGNQVVVSLFGEGTSNRGTTHSSMNAAAVSGLPVVWVCENNGYMGNVPASVYTAVPDIADMAASYGIPGEVVDGNDVLVVHEAAHRAITRARAGKGPSLLELKTYRIRPFGEASADLRDPQEIEAWRARDPIERFLRRLLDAGVLSEAEARSIREAADMEMEAAMAFAEESPFPDAAEAFADLYA